MKVIVWENMDGTLRITYPALEWVAGETEEDYLNYIRAHVVAADPTIDDLPYHYVEADTLPERTRADGQDGTIAVRNAWRWDGSKVVIDEAKI